MEARIRSEAMKDIADAKARLESSTTAHAEAAAEMEARIRAKMMQEAESTTTARVETAAEMEARIRSEAMKDIADAKARLESSTTAHAEAAAEMEARIRA